MEHILLLIFIYSLLCLIVNTTVKNKKSKRTANLYLQCLLFGVFYCFANLKGYEDIPAYQDYFNNIYQFSIKDSSYEVGWYLFNNVVNKIYPSFNFFLFLLRLIQIASFYYVTKRYSRNVWLTTMLLLSLSYFSLFILREYLAIAVCLFSIKFIEERKLMPFLLLVFIAANFHNSAYLWFVTFFLFKLDFDKKSMLLFFLISAALIYSIDSIIGILLPYFWKLELYSSFTNSGSWKTLVFPVVYFIFCLYFFVDKKIFDEKIFVFFFYLISLSLFINIINVSGSSFNQFYRINPYFAISSAFVLPLCISKIKSEMVKYVVSMFVVIMQFGGMFATMNSLYGYSLRF